MTDAVDALRYTSAPTRRTEIIRRIMSHGMVNPSQLATDLGVSERTARRDLQKLAAEGTVRLMHGGAYLPDSFRAAVDFPHRFAAHADAKRAIAERAATHIQPGQSIALDSGTTTLELARLMPQDADLTVVTHSVPAVTAMQSRRDLSLIVLGGVYHPSTMSLSGPDTRSAISRLRVDTLFLSATAFGRSGVRCATAFDAETKRAFIDIAARVVLLADSSKVEAGAPIFVCSLDEVDLLITDRELGQNPDGLSIEFA